MEDTGLPISVVRQHDTVRFNMPQRFPVRNMVLLEALAAKAGLTVEQYLKSLE